MASVIDNKTQQELEAAAQAANGIVGVDTPTTANTTTPAATTTATTTPAAATSLKGVSTNTANKLNQYAQGYQQSASVQAAQNYLNGVLNQKPVADAQLSQLYDQVMNRDKFSYDLNGDALYQQYKEKYQNMGRQAMMDTMGNATALTGGYGSSYAQTAGNQAYQQYLQQLNDIVPELYQQAYNRYNQEGADLLNRYNMAYGQHRDAVSDWEAERNFADNDYWHKYNADYNDYQNQFNYWNQLAQQENAAYYNDRDYAYNLAMAMIQKGTLPSAELLAMAGLSEVDATTLAKKYGYGKSTKKSSGSSSKKSSSSSSGSSGDTMSDYAKNMLSSSLQMLDKGVSKSQVQDRVNFMSTDVTGGNKKLTNKEKQTILDAINKK